jgi:1-acyl-sn-glycerol-3-phosphate acyltransferase
LIKSTILKKLWLNLVQVYVSLGFKFYYKKIETRYHDEIPGNIPILFLSNHQNALLDPLLITVNSTRKNYFLTRADVFSNNMIKRILKSLQMLPVYRVRDGIRTITKNNSIFRRCSEILQEDQSIILFPEGNHSLNRTVRPLSKGFTRIINSYFSNEKNRKLKIIPVGLNYQTPMEYGDSVSIHFGKPIDPGTYLNSKSELDVPGLKNRVHKELQKLTTHIDKQKDYDSTITELNQMKVDFTKPELVNEHLRNGQYKGTQMRKNSFLFSVLKIPIKLVHLIPYLFWKYIFSPRIKDEEFIGTYRYAVCMTLAPIFLIVEAILIALIFGGWYALLFALAGIFLPLIALRLK